MQTFLPLPSFSESAQCLDRQRLGKQRVEVLQLLRALHGETKGWANHPAARMWRGYEKALAEYGVACCREWRSRGYQDTCEQKILVYLTGESRLPPWFGDASFHASHRSNLLRKNFEHYHGRYSWEEPVDLPYVWPVD